jgi:hypothetical protein
MIVDLEIKPSNFSIRRGENNMNMADIKRMSTSERLQTMDALWDSLLYENGEIESPQWHETILEKRKAKIKSGRAKFISLRELKMSREK